MDRDDEQGQAKGLEETALSYWSSFLAFLRALKLALSLPIYYTKYRLARRKAVGTFKREMISSGITPGEADALANLYPFKFSDLMNITKRIKEA
jgi:hypothetical protein